ncbi:MAG: hypothetical protein K5681_08785 [Treponema sp.]|nr:hypothetical protein [Treponema sp.]
MTQENKERLFTDLYELLDIYTEHSPVQGNTSCNIEGVKACTEAMLDYIASAEEAKALKDWMNGTDYWTAPASTRFHGNFKGGLCLHTLMVIKQSIEFAKPVLENFFTSPDGEKYVITAKDIFIAALCHDFCKTGFYGTEYRNTKDITGNWVKQPFYKSRSDNRNLGHGNESVLMMLEILPSMISNRMVIEAVSRHMGFSDLSDSEKFNYSNFLQNPLVVLLQLADETAAQWFGI